MQGTLAEAGVDTQASTRTGAPGPVQPSFTRACSSVLLHVESAGRQNKILQKCHPQLSIGISYRRLADKESLTN